MIEHNLEQQSKTSEDDNGIIFEGEKQLAEELSDEIPSDEDADKIRFLANNIVDINSSNYELSEEALSLFGSKPNILSYLNIYFFKRLSETDLRTVLLEEYEGLSYVKKKEIELANRHVIYKADLKKYFEKSILFSLKDDGFTKNEYIDHCMRFFADKTPNKSKFKNVKPSIKDILRKQYDFIFTQGYSSNLLNINQGTMVANAGDSAQFLFLARAILLGYNSSNVDVRSSRYDAIIDYHGRLLRVQIKGITDKTISFKDRDRGGQGIDSKHERNRGKRITSKECDIYVAVDKQIGTCYIIPTRSYIDNLNDRDAVGVKLSELDDYKENWSIIDQVVRELFG